MACRRLSEGLDDNRNTVRIAHRLRPFGVTIAGPGESDPYKD